MKSCQGARKEGVQAPAVLLSHVAPQGVDLAVVADHAARLRGERKEGSRQRSVHATSTGVANPVHGEGVYLRAVPGGEGVGREARVHLLQARHTPTPDNQHRAQHVWIDVHRVWQQTRSLARSLTIASMEVKSSC
jgi:hypothetical protein